MIFKKESNTDRESEFNEIQQLNSKILDERRHLANLFYLKAELLELEENYDLSLKNIKRANEIFPTYKWQEKIIQLEKILNLL